MLTHEFAGGDPVLGVAFGALGAALDEGATCVALEDLIPVLGPEFWERQLHGGEATSARVAWLRRSLLESGHCVRSDEVRPALLVLDEGDRLFLQRYFEAEKRVALELGRLAGKAKEGARLFREGQEGALELVESCRVCLICGGPGTGKTTTVRALLGKLVESAGPGARLRVRLLAPTGKAAARLAESVAAKGELPGCEVRALTIHRALGFQPDVVARYRHGADDPLSADVVVVDEMSMVDLLLMKQLLEAIPTGCRLLLLGDDQQLSSVQAGSVLTELLSALEGPAKASQGRLGIGVVRLLKSYRFEGGGAVGRLAEALRAGDEQQVRAAWRKPEAELWSGGSTAALVKHLGDRYRRLNEARSPEDALAQLKEFRVLTPVREGTLGVRGLNDAIVMELHRSAPAAGVPRFAGVPLLITQNDPRIGLYNGDVGILFGDSPGGLSAYFPSDGGGLRALAPGALPAHEVAYAMTIHKSQGSEFREVLVVLGGAQGSISQTMARDVLTRQLLYTAVTRAQERVTVFGEESTVLGALARVVPRRSGLKSRLMESTGAL
jgi:exodeoxyribonuclease V alpha subunit